MANRTTGRAVAALTAWLGLAVAVAAPAEVGRLLGAVVAWLVVAAVAQASEPELPRAWVDTAPLAVTGRTLAVEAGGDLGKALRDARPGDEITLAPGAVYRGPFELPRKEGEGWIVLRTAALDELPAGVRATPADAAAMAVLEAGSGHPAVVYTAPGAAHYRLQGLEIRPRAGEFLYNVVAIGRGDESADELPHHIVIERSYIHGDPAAGARRGVTLNGRHAAVVDSYLSDFKEVGADSQAIGGWNGPGPFKIVNNYLEGAGENVMFGGGTAAIDGLVPADIEIRANHFHKPLAWRIDDPAYAGTPWAVKNLLELKNARRVLIDGNLFEHSWTHGQTGFAVLFTVRNEGGDMPWAAVHDVTFTNNLVRRAGNGVNVLGGDTNDRGDQRARRLLIANNRFEDIGGEWGGGRLFQLLNGTESVTIRDNTADQSGSIVVSGGRPHENFVFAGNVAPHNRYGIVGSGTAPGAHTLEQHFPGARVADNTIAGGSAARYPAGNAFPKTAAATDRGADMAALCAALADARPPAAGLQAVCR